MTGETSRKSGAKSTIYLVELRIKQRWRKSVDKFYRNVTCFDQVEIIHWKPGEVGRQGQQNKSLLTAM